MSHLYILTLTWNACDKLVKLKESLMPNLNGIDYTWLIKDNNSNDDTIKVASDWEANIKVIPYKNNLQNFSQGMNYIFDIASPKDNDLILLLNNDVTFGDDTSLKNMIKLLKNDIGVVGSKLLYTGTNKLQHAGVVFESKYNLPTHFRANQIDDDESSKDRLFQAVTGAVMLLRAEDYKNICKTNKSGIGGLCEELIWCFDDIDACMAVKNNTGKKIIYCGNTKIFHEESASLKKNPVNRLFMNYNAKFFIKKWTGKYIQDSDFYLRNSKYNIYKQG